MNWFWDNICLKKADRAGMFAFLSILFLLLIAKWYLLCFYQPKFSEVNIEGFENMEYVNIEDRPFTSSSAVEKPKTVIQPSQHKKILKKVPKYKSELPSTLVFDFDPNTLSKDSLMLLGLSAYAANNIIKYRASGGKFSESGDLSRIYGMEEQVFNKIRPYVKIKKRPAERKTHKTIKPNWNKKKYSIELNSININTADTTTLKSLNGIGTVYANRIVKFRNSLGGFFAIDQIRDVWGISDSLFISIEPYLTIDVDDLQKKNINLLDKEKLVKHPYIDWKKAKAIISYRKMHGDYKSMDDFKKLHGIETDFVDTLKHYFVVQ